MPKNMHNHQEGEQPQGGERHDHDAGNAGGHAHGHDHDHAAMIAEYRRRFWVSLVLTVPILALSPLIQGVLGLEQVLAFPGDSYVQFVLATAVFFYGGWPFVTGLVRELGQRQPGMMTLIGFAITVAYTYSSAVVFGLEGRVFFWELATLIDVMLLGHWIEMRSIMGASGAVEELVRMLPDSAHRLKPDGGTEEVPVSELEKNDRILVRPGDKVPIDGVVVDGHTSMNESMISGESKPVEKQEGDDVIGGAVNGEGAITIEVQKTGEETYLAQVVDMVRRAQASRSRTQDLANRAAGWLFYIALTVGLTTLAVWLAIGRDFQYALARMVTVMVITCPHALGLAVPLVVAVSTSLSAGHGLLIRNRTAFERGRNLDAVIFDKTGTLTEGRFGVSAAVPLREDLSKDEVLAWAASLESRSEHPIAEGITAAAKDRDLERKEVSDFQNIPGQGAQATVSGKSVKVVGPGYLRENGLEARHEAIDRMAKEGQTVVYLLINDAVAGAIGLADVIRPESREAIKRLKEMDLSCMMLTGDSEAVAATVAGELGLDAYFAEVLPDKKAEQVKKVKADGKIAAMVGDGVNDAPALVEADLGIAIGAGTDVAVQSADIVLVRNDPRDVVAILALSRANHGKMVQNFFLATAYNVVAIPLAAGIGQPWGIVISPAIGAALMSLSTVVVAINAKLLQRFRVAEDRS